MATRGSCVECHREVNWLRRKAAAELSDVTPHTISRWALAGLLHLWEQPGNRYLICEQSLEGVERGHRQRLRARVRLIPAASGARIFGKKSDT